jgi:hypothetical protein
MEHTRLKSDNNVLCKILGNKNSKIEEFRAFYISFFFAFQILVTVSSVDTVQDTAVCGTTVFSPSRLVFDPRPTRLFITNVITVIDTDRTVVIFYLYLIFLRVYVCLSSFD